MKNYTKALILVLGIGVGFGARGFVGNTNMNNIAYGDNNGSYANRNVEYNQLGGNDEENNDQYNEQYDEYGQCRRDDYNSCGGSRENRGVNQNYRDNMMNGGREL